LNIILGSDNADALRDRYTVLELDTFRLSPDQPPVTAYCVIDHVPLPRMPMISHDIEVHQDLIQAYKTQQWHRCVDSIHHLRGCWNGELDEFYDIMIQRIDNLSVSGLDSSWTGIIEK
jgi:hypothetical protein